MSVEVCPTCGKPRDLMRVCPCGQSFTVNAEEVVWYVSRNLAVPKYCGTCRAARRKQREENARNARAGA